MRVLPASVVSVLLLSGCGHEQPDPPRRTPVTAAELAIVVRGGSRSFMQSDRAGAFLVGKVGTEGASTSLTADGADVVSNLVVETSRGSLAAVPPDSTVILPWATRKFYPGGTVVTESILEGIGTPGVHGVAIRVAAGSPGMIALRVIPATGFVGQEQEGGAHEARWIARDGRTIVLNAGGKGKAGHDAIACEGVTGADFLLLQAPAGTRQDLADRLMPSLDTLLAARAGRIERLLFASYCKTSDDTLNKALNWMKVSLDGLMVDARDTFAVSGLPWDGAIDVRDNAQSIAGLGLATGDYRRTAAILRTLARHQDTDPRSTSFGRLPDRIAGHSVTYRAADVAPWFVRELYEHVVYANDTSLARALYPVISRSINGTMQRHTDRYNFLTHGPLETWMANLPRGNRAVEVQLLWYFQQLIGSYVASFLADTAHARVWWDSSVKTSDSFTAQFVDTTAWRLADFLRPDGSRDTTMRPNGIMCLEMLETEKMRYEVTRATVHDLLRADGVATRPASAVRSTGMYDGPEWTWLVGPVTYAVTRYDRQDLTYQVTRALARRVLTEGMAGTLPAHTDPTAEGARASLMGMAEFVRTVYQDYLGLRVDLASKTLTIQPKLPDALTEAEFTVYAGPHPIHGFMSQKAAEGRIRLVAPDLPEVLKVSFVWILGNGDAWRGTARLMSNTPMTLVVTPDDAVLFQGEQKSECDAKRQLKKFSQRASAAEFAIAPQ